QVMLSLTTNPEFGHITTFGGHPVCAAAALANLEVLTGEPDIIEQVETKGKMYEEALSNHSLVKAIRRKGLLMSVELNTELQNQKVMQLLLANGLVTDPFFFMPQAFRIAPPLTITISEIELTIELIIKSLDELSSVC
ncbi:MAG: aminotransferase class III-fold pyridoxal phosphate-dependent enzyme, partial [Bacteroidales bacterium]|nr:aminotransferase class III-fold pyridoxal phosphate-dependent enzyme [Bacteroidales bacterium]